MSEPRTIWATPFDEGITSGTYAAEETLPKLPPNGDASRYHHDAVVRELVEALKAADARLTYSEEAFRDQGCHSRAKACREVLYQIDAALAKIAQETPHD